MQTNSQQLCNATVTGIYQQFQDYLQSIAESTGTFREMCVEDLEEIWLQAKEIRDNPSLFSYLNFHSTNKLKIILSRPSKEWVIYSQHSSKSVLRSF